MVLFIFLLLFSGGVFASSDYVEIGPNSTMVYFPYESAQTANFNVRTLSYIADPNESYSSPSFFSSNVDFSWIWFSLRDSNHEAVTGIKVSRIEFVQNDTLVARVNKVESRSINGQYSGDIEFLNPFQNENGENLVDVVFYLGSKEVARLKDFKLGLYSEPVVTRVSPNSLGIYTPKFQLSTTLINVDKNSKIEVYLVDKDGNNAIQVDKVVSDYYSSWDNTRRINLNVSFKSTDYLNLENTYSYVVTVDDKEIEILDYPYANLTDYARITSITNSAMPNLDLNVRGVNLLNYGPYKVVIEQEGKVTKEINNVYATFNEERYEERITLQLLPVYFNKYGEMYNVKIYDTNEKKLLDFDFLVPVDDTSEIEDDIVNPLEGFRVFEKKENVEPAKTWRVRFSKPIDKASVNDASAYVINKRTGISFKVDYKLESTGEVLAMSPIGGGFDSGETYILIIDKRIKSEDGANLSQPAAIEFTIR